MKAGNLRISGFQFSRERVVADSGIVQHWLPAEAFAQQTEHKLARTARRASDSKSAEHKKSFSGAAWIFCMEPFCFGVTRGEQPLVRASRASKVAGAFLVLFWHAKENIPGGDASCKRHETLNTRLRSVREAFQIRRWPSQPPLPAR